jgi:hypothetical protein
MNELDRRLREAGRRLRDTAPTAAATETALDLLDTRTGPSRVRWIAPLAFVAAAAAAVIGVLVVTRPEESGRVVPAETSVVPATSAAPVTSAAPTTMPPTTTPPTTASTTTASTTTSSTTSTTSSTSTTSTTAPPPAGPAFVGGLPLDAPAAIVGCPGTFGDLAEAVDPATWPVASLACAGGYAVATAVGHPDGTIHELRWDGAWTSLGGGTSHPCDVPDDICTAFDNPSELGDVARPLPPAWIVEDPNFLPATDTTERVADLGVAVTGDAEAFATALGEALQAITPGDPVPRVETAVLDGVPVVTVTLNGIPDDSSSRQVYVVRYADQDGTLTTADSLAFTYCNRGVTNDGLCL